MSTQPRTTEPETTAATTRPRFRTRDAPRVFDPHNTNTCPRMFADKWQVEPETEAS
jgi:hypothetical protein